MTNVHKDLSDLSGSNDPDRFSMKLCSNQIMQRKIKLPCPVIRFMDPPYACQQQCHGMFCDGKRRVCRYMHDMKLSKSRLDIHIIIAGTSKSQYLNTILSQLVDHLGIDHIIDKHTNRITAFGQLYGILV
jgi:hypothetical protein